jgi:hypothetical protein
MAAHHPPHHERRHADITVREASLTVRIVLWVIVAAVVVALSFWWFST